MSRLTLAVITMLAALIGAAPASAAACPPKPTKQAFAQFMDPAYYVLSNEGAFEGANRSWTLSGARAVNGNEPFYLNERNDTRSLVIGAGGFAVSPRNCMSLEHVTTRFVVRSTGSSLGVLTVSAIVGDFGLELPVGAVTGLSSAWQPSLPMVLSSSLLSTLGETGLVRLRFSVTGPGGAFQIDDIYIDPYKKG